MRVYTTGQAAVIFQVAPRTISKWFDAGELKGYKVPGSEYRRILHESMETCMQKHGMPLVIFRLFGQFGTVYLPGAVTEILDVSPQFLWKKLLNKEDPGSSLLKGAYRLPISGFWRIPKLAIVGFLRTHDLPYSRFLETGSIGAHVGVPEAMRTLKRGRLRVFEMIKEGILEGFQMPGSREFQVFVESLQKAQEAEQ